MALDPSFIGRTYPPSAPYEVGREKIREFAEAVGETHPVHTDPDTARSLGYPDVIAPPTFPIVLTARIGAQVIHDPALGLDYSRVVHGDQRFVAARPIVAGDRLVGIVTVENIRSAAGNDLITTRVDLADEGGEHVCTAHSTLVSRGPSSG